MPIVPQLTVFSMKNGVPYPWDAVYTNALLEGLNGLFQAARARARGYRMSRPSSP